MDLNPEKPIQWESRKVHPLIKRLFLSKSIPDVPLAGRLKHFVEAWMKIAQDPKILDIVKGYKIPFHSKPFQSKIPSQPIVSREGEELVKLEVKEMLIMKGAIRKVQPNIKRGVCKQLIPRKKEGWGPKTSDKFEATECIYPMLSLQNGRFAKSEIHVAKRMEITCANLT